MDSSYPNTDPWADRVEGQPIPPAPEIDRLYAKGSTTPWMISKSRVIVMLLAACYFIYMRGRHAPKRQGDPEYGGLTFPHEIKIAGVHQYAIGGSAAPFGSVGIYIQKGAQAQHGWQRLEAFTKGSGSALEERLVGDAGFFEAFAHADVGKSLLLIFGASGPETDSILASLRPALTRLGEYRSARFEAALRKTLEAAPSPLPATGQLYLTCYKGTTYMAYGAPLLPPKEGEVKRPRNMARIIAQVKEHDSELTDEDIPGCAALFNAFTGVNAPISPDARMGLARGFAHEYGVDHDEL